MRARRVGLILFLLLLPLWLLVGARPLKPEPVIIRLWARDLSGDLPSAAAPRPAAGAPAFSVATARNLVFFETDGTVSAAYRDIGPTAVAGNRFFVTPGPAQEHVLESHDRRVLARLPVPGIPFAVNERFYVVGPFQSSLSALDEDLSTLWFQRYPGFVITLATGRRAGGEGAGATLVGLSDGTARLVADDGEELARFGPLGPREPVLGVALSPSGELAVTASPGGLAIYRVEDPAQPALLVPVEALPGGAVRLDFAETGARLFLATADRVGVLDMESGDLSVFRPQGRVLSLTPLGEHLVRVLWRDTDGRVGLAILTTRVEPVVQSFFDALDAGTAPLPSDDSSFAVLAQGASGDLRAGAVELGIR